MTCLGVHRRLRRPEAVGLSFTGLPEGAEEARSGNAYGIVAFGARGDCFHSRWQELLQLIGHLEVFSRKL